MSRPKRARAVLNTLAAHDDDHWSASAACRSMWHLFDDPDCTNEKPYQRKVRERQAKAICADCPVRAQCRADIDAWETDPKEHHTPHGIFAGETAAERVARRRRGSAGTPRGGAA